MLGLFYLFTEIYFLLVIKENFLNIPPPFDAFEYLPVASYLRNELEIFCSLITIIHRHYGK